MNSFPKIVGFSGYAGSGKNTAAEALLELGYQMESFAKPLKEMALAINVPLSIETIYDGVEHYMRVTPRELVEDEGWDGAKRYPEFRAFLQCLGTEVGRNILGQDIWVEQMERRVWRSTSFPFAITDVRFPNESNYCKWPTTWRQMRYNTSRSQEGMTIWIDRPGLESGSHASESGEVREMADVMIYNTGTIEELHEKVLGVVTNWEAMKSPRDFKLRPEIQESERWQYVKKVTEEVRGWPDRKKRARLGLKRDDERG